MHSNDLETILLTSLNCVDWSTLISPTTEKRYAFKWLETQWTDKRQRHIQENEEVPWRHIYSRGKGLWEKSNSSPGLACNQLCRCGQVSFTFQSPCTHRRLVWKFSEVSFSHASLVIGSCSSRPGSTGADLSIRCPLSSDRTSKIKSVVFLMYRGCNSFRITKLYPVEELEVIVSLGPFIIQIKNQNRSTERGSHLLKSHSSTLASL